MYKIYSGKKVVYLTSNISGDLASGFDAILKYGTQGELIGFLDRFHANNTAVSAFLYFHDVETLLKKVKACFRNIHAAGGLVWNREGNQILAITRHGYFDLPKGKVENGETFEVAAAREVEEECGIKDPVITSNLTTTFHTYTLDGQQILKETRWFEMVYYGDLNPSANVEEGIESVFWVAPANLSKFIPNTYPSIIDVLRASARCGIK